MSLYNDDGEAHEVELLVSGSRDLTEGCGPGCHGHGECVAGACICDPGYDGESCELSVCPLLCSGQGEYSAGECVCRPGWKGKECNVR